MRHAARRTVWGGWAGLLAALLAVASTVAAPLDAAMAPAARLVPAPGPTLPVTASPVAVPSAPAYGATVEIDASVTNDAPVTGAEIQLDGGAWVPMGSTDSQFGDTVASAGAILGRAVRVATGGQHSCAVFDDGTVRCWGTGLWGVLGDGTGTDHRMPARVPGITNARDVVAGLEHTCALTDDGAVWCWGSNQYGKLGDGTITDRPAPVQVSDVSGAIAITAGIMHTCAVLEIGAVRCWGYNYNGQLGDGTTTDRLAPVTVTGLSTAIAVVAGGSHTCALLADGGVRCWGDNTSSQLGSAAGGGSYEPVAVSLPAPATSLASGYDHVCAVLATAAVLCWGSNTAGETGQVSGDWTDTPTVVPGVDATSVAAGVAHTCAVLVAGGLACWGYNSTGQLGDGTTTSRATAAPVVGLPAGAIVDAGGGMSSASCVVIADGDIRCWGDNYTAQLGDGTDVNRTTPVAIQGLIVGHPALGSHSVCVRASGAAGTGDTSCGAFTVAALAPVVDHLVVTPPRAFYGTSALVSASVSGPGLIAGAEARVDGGLWRPVGALDGAFDEATEQIEAMAGGAVQVSHGYHHTCAAMADGSVWCWGWNGDGQLGDGTLVDRPLPVQVPGISTATAVATGWSFSCALLRNGGITCWGSNSSGEVGTGTPTEGPILVPTPVSGITTAVDLDLGLVSACAVLADGSVRCWGNNMMGQLGRGTTDPATSVAAVPGISTATAIAAGEGHTCALLAGGSLTCWGSNWYGQLGDPRTATAIPTPVAVSGTGVVAAIALGAGHTCAMAVDGSVRCWGDDLHGQLGDGGSTARLAPQVVAGIPTATSISAGYNHTCILTTGGTVWCWGAGSAGQLGTGSQPGVGTPTEVANLTGVVSIGGGSDHTCAIATAAIACWGSNADGQLANGSVVASTVPMTGALAGPLGLGSHQVCLRATGADGHRSPGTSCATFVVVGPDSTAPVFTKRPVVGPRAGAVLPSAATGSAIPVTVSWAADDTAAGIGLHHYVLERRIGTGAWTRVALATPLATSAATTVASSGTVTFRVTAYDAAGNHATAATVALAPRLVQQTSTSMHWTGTWTTAAGATLSGGSARWARTAGASFQQVFTGRAVGIVVTQGPGRGSARIVLDGKTVATISLAGATTRVRVVAWQWSSATAGRHTLKLVVAGTAGHPRVDVDALVVVP